MYQPSDEILKKYADVLVKFAPHAGGGIKPGETFCIQINESAKPLLPHLQRAVLEAGAHPLIDYIPEGIDRDFYMLGSEDQINYTPKNWVLGKLADMDHLLVIRGEEDVHALDGVPSDKIMKRLQSRKFLADARHEKEYAGKFGWCIALFGTESAAKEAGLSLEEYWQEIIQACFLDMDDPIAKWKETFAGMETYRKHLTDMQIESVHIVGEDADIHIKIGANRQWVAGGGKNIPSFEIFTSPDWRGTNGWIRFSQPMYRYGTIIKGIELHFENGVITKATAKENEQALLDMIAVENANKLGEVSLTDHRMSRITKFMADTLFDENVGGRYGNTHIAVGQGFHNCYIGDPMKPTKEEWAMWGFNESAVHTDLISTTDRTVTATLQDGSEVIIYKDGEFVI